MGRASIFISGTVSQMPKYRDVSTKNGAKQVMTFSLPADRGWGERKVSTFFECEYFMPDSERGQNYLARAMGKGAKVAVEGEPYANEWTDREGNKRTSIRVDVRALDILTAAPAEEVREDDGAPVRTAQNGSEDVYDEDIPF
jgi:single-stranded DNA-binding protein